MNVELVGKGDNRIGEDGKIGTGTNALNGVGVRSDAGVKAGGGGGGKVAAGAEAHDADFIGIDMEFGGAGANGAERALRIVQHGGMAILGAEAIAENESRDALGVEPLRDLFSFVIDGEGAITAAGTDDDGLAVGFPGKPRRQCGDVFIVSAQCARGGACPERERGRVWSGPLGEQRGGGEKQEDRFGHWGNDIAGLRKGARPITILVNASSEFDRRSD